MRWLVCATLVVAQCASVGAQHEGHGGNHASANPAVHYLTVNVALTDTAFDPAAVFVPVGRPVRLMLRNRSLAEHHYRVAGLEPQDLWWMDRGGDAAGPASRDAHDHHNAAYVRIREQSPAGIAPTGREVHGWVTAGRNVDAVLFTATQPGTYTVHCDIHQDVEGRLVVFETPTAGAAPDARSAALTRDLGLIGGTDAAPIRVEAMYSPREDGDVTIVLTEQRHAAELPSPLPPPELALGGITMSHASAAVLTDSVHHRATAYRFTPATRLTGGHQVMTLRLASGQEATWHLPIAQPTSAKGWGLVLALLGGMLAAMWPCLFQLTVYFIPALAGLAMQQGDGAGDRRRPVLRAASYFILGFTVVYTATGGIIGYMAERVGHTSAFEGWQRYIGPAAGLAVIALALRVAVNARAPLVCRMPALSRLAGSARPATRIEMMLAGVAFATGCMTCFGSALAVGMVVYIGMAQSALYGAAVLFLFSLGMGVPLVIAAVAMAKALPVLMKLEDAVPWMGLASAVLMTGFGVLLISGRYMAISEWTYRAVSGMF
jgi:cytochrome c-type biogenesis protein